MFVTRLQFLLFCMVSTLGTMVGTAQSLELRKEINKLIAYETQIDLKNNPGFMVGIIDNDSTFFLRYGARADNSGGIYDEQSVFEIGGLSKVFTAGLIEVLVESKQLSYADKVNTYLPSEQQNPRMEELTIMDLVLHTSGLPKRPSMFGKKEKERNNPYKYYTKEDLIQFYTHYVPKESIGDQFRYSHTNYALLEVLLEAKFKISYENLLQEYLLDILKMDDTYVEETEHRNARLSKGYNRAGIDASPWVFKSFGGSEGIKSNVEELTYFVRASMGISNTFLDHILPNTHKIQATTNYNKDIHLGKAWHVIDQKSKFAIRMHTGTTGGHKSFVAFVDETKTGVVILSNSSLGTEDLGMLILRMINHNWKRKA